MLKCHFWFHVMSPTEGDLFLPPVACYERACSSWARCCRNSDLLRAFIQIDSAIFTFGRFSLQRALYWMDAYFGFFSVKVGNMEPAALDTAVEKSRELSFADGVADGVQQSGFSNVYDVLKFKQRFFFS